MLSKIIICMVRDKTKQNEVNHWNQSLRRIDKMDDIQNWRGKKIEEKIDTMTKQLEQGHED